MIISSQSKSPARQVLVNLGNRYVVFAHEMSQPPRLSFDPIADTKILSRVADESEIAYERITQTIRVTGMQTVPIDRDEASADLILVDDAGNKTFIDVKVSDSNFKSRDYERAFSLIRESKEKENPLEIWLFNIGRLKLETIAMLDGNPTSEELYPVDVWERTEKTLFRREKVIEEVNTWASRLSTLYDEIELWLNDRAGLTFDRTRTLTMSEEIMQQFAVTDRDLPLLDVIKEDQIIATFVPRGLWLIGAWGRVDVITRSRQTVAIVGIKENSLDEKTFSWRVISMENHKSLSPLTKEALLSVVFNP